MAVDPRGISRTCAACGEDDRRNRAGKVLSIACDHKGDADVIGARKDLDQNPCGTRACNVPGAEMSAIKRDVSGQTVRRRIEDGGSGAHIATRRKVLRWRRGNSLDPQY